MIPTSRYIKMGTFFRFSCTRFTFPPNKHMDGRELTCVAYFPGLDTLSESDAVQTSGKLKVDECKL